MLSWIGEHSDMLNVLVGAGTLIVWLLYLQLFLYSYRRQTTPSLLISRAGGKNLEARCVLSNMSRDAIHLQSLICTLREANSEVSVSIEEIEEISDRRRTGAEDVRFGPLQPGEALSVGQFGDLLRRLREDGGTSGADGGNDEQRLPARLEIQVVAVYGAEDLLVSAKRAFHISMENGRILVTPCTVDTTQVRSTAERKQLSALLKNYQ